MANLRVNKITGTEVFETTGSVQFNDGYLSFDKNILLDLNNYSDWTIECWIYRTANATNERGLIIGFDLSGSIDSNILAVHNDGYLYMGSDGGSNATPKIQTPNNTISFNTWYHISVVKKSTSIKLFVNGIESASGTRSTWNFTDLSIPGLIGSRQANDTEFFGHISNLRILKGTALYTSNFTPPTRELTVIPNTVLLCCQSTTRANEERTGKTITVNGNAVANELTPGLLTDKVKSGGDSAISGSVEFDGNDYLAVSSSDFAFGTGDFTLEFWFYDTSPTSGIRRWITSTLGAFGSPTFVIREQSGSIGYRQSSSTVTYSKSNTSWSHIAYTRKSGVEYVFVNGILLGSASSTSNYADNTLYIGGYYNVNDTEYTQGFISNLRIIKGNALYTQNFIPPTRELKRLPGTVLLCCKNTSDPTAEETGKTITPYGSLVYNPPELVNDGAFNSASSWPSAQADWSISGGKATINSANSGYDYLGILTNRTTNGLLYELRFDISSWTAGRLELAQSDSSNIGVTVSGNGPYAFRFRYTGPTNGNISLYSYTDTTASFTLDNLSLKQVASVPSPPFTPSVGFDRIVTFDGVTKINTPNYFYLPTGNTEDRGRGRGVFGGGTTGPNINVIQYINVQSSGNAIDFGDLTVSRRGLAACSSSTRGVFGGGTGGTPDTFKNTLDYITISTTGNAQSFGNLTDSLRQKTALSNSTRGVFAGGYNPLFSNIIEYITISSTGNAQDFGDLSAPNRAMLSCSSSTRGCFAGSAPSNVIEYITINSTGNTSDFGDLTVARGYSGGCSNPTRGVFGGGAGPAGQVNVIDYITISSTGNAQDFGDLTAAKADSNSCSSSNRGFFAGGYTPTVLNTIEFITISSTGNAQDFGDLLLSITQLAACSDSHGGLG